MKPATHVWKSLQFNNGDTPSIESKTATNGELEPNSADSWDADSLNEMLDCLLKTSPEIDDTGCSGSHDRS